MQTAAPVTRARPLPSPSLRALPLDDAGAAGGPASPRRSLSSRRGAGAFALASAPAAPDVVSDNVLASARSSRSIAAAGLVLSTGASGRGVAAGIQNPLAASFAAPTAGGGSSRALRTAASPPPPAAPPRSSSRDLLSVIRAATAAPAPVRAGSARLSRRSLSFRGGDVAEGGALAAALRAAAATSAKLASAPSARGIAETSAQRGDDAGDGRASFAAEGTQ
jgi:hypothetical protein